MNTTSVRRYIEKIIATFAVMVVITTGVPNFVFAVEGSEEQNEIYESLLSNNGKEENDKGNVTYASGVTKEMAKSEYWTNLSKNKDKVIMTKSEIADLNQKIIDAKGTYVFDIESINEISNASEESAIDDLIGDKGRII